MGNKGYRIQCRTYKCLICKKKFHPSRKEHLTCSRKCGTQIRKGKTAIAEKVEVTCHYCQTKFKRRLSRLKAKRGYCSQRCHFLDRKQLGLYNSKQNPNYKNGPIIRNCIKCKKEFKTYHKNQRYCNPGCIIGMNTKSKGRRYEWKSRDILKAEGYTVIRSSASLTPADLIAIKKEEILLIQVKATKYIKANLLSLFKKEIQELSDMQCPDSTKKEFWVWQDKKGLTKIKVPLELNL